MEILSPAGNFEQVLAGISGGCNAIYGGLKAWNARNRANNFSIDEYIKVINYCKSKGVKFYLTLNNILRNSEIENIIKVFEYEKFVFPDAVIITDVGLIKKLKENFPRLPIHISTQFGIHCLDDVKYVESLGASRIILSREVLIEDIKKIKNQTSLEIEVFLWGSQCIGFSGKCYWGSMVLGGSGNRGRCIGLCRNIYSHNGELGQFFYSKDLDAINKIQQLKDIGVCSVKIEGRMRNPEEIFKIVSKIKNNIELKQNKISKGYCGYLDNELPVHGLVEKVNSRNKITRISASNINKYDRLVRFDEKGNLKFEYSYMYKGNDKTIGHYTSSITNKVTFEKRNISLRLFICDNNSIEKIDYINEYGERKVFIISNIDNGSREKSIEEIYCYLSNELEDYNIYEFSFPKLVINKLIINNSELDKIIKEIKLSNDDVKTDRDLSYNLELYNKLSVEIDNIDMMKSLEIEGIRSIIYKIENYNTLVEMINRYGEDTRVIYKLPLFDWYSNGIDDYLKLLEGKKIMLTRWSHLNSIKDKNFNEVSCDYTFNCWNNICLDELKKNKISRITGTPELSIEENIKLANKSNINLEIIFAGKIPLIYSRHCFNEVLKCTTKCGQSKCFYDIDKDLNYEMYCKETYRELVLKTPILGNVNEAVKFKELDIIYRYVARFDDCGEVERAVKEMLNSKDYYKSIIKNNIWNNTYQGNLIESVK